MAKPIFKYGTLSQYKNLVSTDSNTLYFITDRGLIFKGNREVTSHVELDFTHLSDIDSNNTSVGYVTVTDQSTDERMSFNVYKKQAVDSLITFAIAYHLNNDIGNGSDFGHVKLTDDYNLGLDVDDGYAATPKALSDMYTVLREMINNMESATDFQGTIGTLADGGMFQSLPTPSDGYEKGWTYIVVSEARYGAGDDQTISQVGDTIIAIRDSVGSSTSIVSSDWINVHPNNSAMVTTGDSSLPQGRIIVGNGGKTVTSISSGNAGDFLMDDGRGPVWHTLTNGEQGFFIEDCIENSEDQLVVTTNETIKINGIFAIRFPQRIIIDRLSIIYINREPFSIYYRGEPIGEQIITSKDTATFIVRSMPEEEGAFTVNGIIELLCTDKINPLSLSELSNDTGGVGTCTVSGGTSLNVTLEGFKRTTNSLVSVRFSNNAVLANSTLTFNNVSTTAKPIYHMGLPLLDNVILAGDTVTFCCLANSYMVLAIDRPNSIGIDMGNPNNATATDKKLPTVGAVYSAIKSSMCEWEVIQS